MLSRRRFLQSTIAGLAFRPQPGRTIAADVAIIGGGTGGCAAALAALSMNCKVIMTEPTDWIGGQFTQQGVPPDENSWIESFGGTQSYLKFRSAIRRYYRQAYPLRLPELENLNPGACGVSRLCHEPHVALAVFRQLLAPYISSGQLTIITQATPAAASISADRVESVRLKGTDTTIAARFFLDATEDGALLPLTGTEYVQGAEEDSEELHASQRPGAANMQAPTWCFAMEYRPGEDHTITRPASYDFWNSYIPPISPPWPGKLFSLTYSHPITLEPRTASFDPRPGAETEHFNLWTYRRLIDPALFEPGTYAGGISLVNWPQNDYMEGNLFGDHDVAGHLQQARELSRALFYWLQTEVPREDGGQGWPGLRLRGDILGTSDGLAKAPYIRESRRIRARFTVREDHVGQEARGNAARAAQFDDSVGIGSYRIDLHPSTGGDNYIDVASWPFQIPLGALVPERMQNLVPACKNIGVTHITGGCYRLHPVEWNIGEAAGALAAYCLAHNTSPQGVYERRVADFQRVLVDRGVPLAWPETIY
ncbi:MAG: FAD-dependent oxidoreductase [Bacteroidota bacterium]|nr:FAD-dependent oxidoreductase [Bacteroidota bacterium]MDE2957233.1 FAD-dependent oxidoreductase [Bacteroidota bacterium]